MKKEEASKESNNSCISHSLPRECSIYTTNATLVIRFAIIRYAKNLMIAQRLKK